MQALNNALFPFIGGPGLNVFINQGVVLANGSEVSFPSTVVGLPANTTSFVFINVGTSTIQSNTTGFISNSYPIATVTTTNTGIGTLIDNRPDYVLTGSSTGIPGRFILAFGTALNSGNFGLSGWGAGASLSVTGKDSLHQIAITAGTTPSQGPTATLTFADGAWNQSPLVFASQSAGSMLFPVTSSTTLTSYTLKFNGLPLAGNVYTFNILVAGLS